MLGDGVTVVDTTATNTSHLVTVKAASGFAGSKSMLRLEVGWALSPLWAAAGLSACLLASRRRQLRLRRSA